MKLQLHRVDEPPCGFLTVGYWRWDQPNNKGTLHIYWRKMKHKRHEIAVFGHELLELLWCKLRGITTERCDEFDQAWDREVMRGNKIMADEGGCDPSCPYHVGHELGILWEYLWIWTTCGLWWGWKRYLKECDQLLGIS